MPLSRASASADSFRCTSFAVPSRGEATAICTAAMPTPRAFLRLEEPLPDDDPTSDAPSRRSRHPRIGSMHRPAAVSTRLSLKRPLGGALLANFSFGKDAGVSTSRIDREDQDASATADKGDRSASGAPTVVPRRHRRVSCWSKPRAVGGCSTRIRPRRRTSRTRSPRHPPIVRVNGAIQVPSWLGGSSSPSFDSERGASKDACDRQMPNIRLH